MNLRPNYLEPYKGFPRATAHTAATARNTEANPLLFSISALGSFTCDMGPMALRPIRRAKQWLCVLLKDTSVTAGDSKTNPHSLLIRNTRVYIYIIKLSCFLLLSFLQLFVNNVMVESPDLLTDRGVVHVISEVMIPLQNHCDIEQTRTTLVKTKIIKIQLIFVF